jgi:Capsule assembly protein Wzi
MSRIRKDVPNHTKKIIKLQIASRFCLLFLTVLLLLSPLAEAGIYSEHDVYSFLQRAWLYGATDQPAPTIRPESIPELIALLNDCDANRDQLPPSEQAELDELLSEFRLFSSGEMSSPKTLRWHKLLPENSPLFTQGAHLYGAQQGDLRVSFDPVIAWQAILDEDYNDEVLLRSVIGVDIQAAFGSNWTAGIRFTDTAEYNQNDQAGVYSPSPGKIASVSPAGASASFDETLAYLEYNSEFVDLGIGRDRVEFGPTLDHGLILSGEAPAYVYLQLRARLKPWLAFNYLHARLDPSPVKEEVYYVSPSGKQRKVVNQKWMAAHRLEVNPTHWMQFGLSETVIYAERDPEVGYMIPLNIFWSENHHQDRDDNIAWGIDLRVKALEGVSLYLEGLLDETSLSGILSDKLHNRTAYTLGIDAIEPLGLRGSLLQLHLTRLRPYVYSHWFAVSVYAHNGTALGSSIPPNSEAITLRFCKRIRGVWEISALAQRLQHGETPTGENAVGGSIFELVPVGDRNRPYPILQGMKTTAWRGEVNLNWEPLENLTLSGRVGLTRVENETLALFLAGFAYNL